MIQIFRTIKKPGVCSCVRRHGTQRCQPNYYEILKIPPNSTQKDIRTAFITLSKELHPDISGKSDHKDFVKLNEAYTVLSKEHTRRQYDMSLQHQTYPSTFNPRAGSNPGNTNYYYYYHNPYRSHYASQRQWEEHMARGAWKPSPTGMSLRTWVLCFVGLILIVTFQMALYQRLALVKKHMAKQRQYQKEYNETKERIKNMTREEELLLMEQKLEEYELKRKQW